MSEREKELIERIVEMGETHNVEIKRMLYEKDLKLAGRKEKLIAQLKYITSDGPGVFIIGLEDIDGKRWEVYGLSRSQLESSERILKALCEEAGIRIVEEEIFETEYGYVGKYVLERAPLQGVQISIGINVVGRVNAGKSTLIGVMVTGKLDNGKGKARAFLLKHPQELKKGQTADLHQAVLGIDDDNKPIFLESPLNKEELALALDRSRKIIIFHDAPGHAEYAKTMIRSVLGQDAQYGLVLIPANDEYKIIVSEEMRTGRPRLDEITREHMLLLINQGLPFMVAISKIDTVSREALLKVMTIVKKTLKDIGKVPLVVRTLQDVNIAARELPHGSIVPIFQISTTTGIGINLLRELITKLPPTVSDDLLSKPALAYIDKVYRGISGTNVVVTGTVRSGVFKPGQTVIVGPDENGEFLEARIATIEIFKKRVERVKAGDAFGIDLKKIDPKIVRRGQVIADPDFPVKAVRTLEANIVVTRHPTRIVEGYSPVLHCHTVSQTVIFEKIYGKRYLVVGDFARVRMRFKFRPEMVLEGDKIVTRESNTRTIGTIIAVH